MITEDSIDNENFVPYSIFRIVGVLEVVISRCTIQIHRSQPQLRMNTSPSL